MNEMTNHLQDSRDSKIKQFELGVATEGIEYLKKMNKQVNKRVKEMNLKTKNYLDLRHENIGDDENEK